MVVGSSRGAAQEIGLGSAQAPCTWVGTQASASQQLNAVGCRRGTSGDKLMEKEVGGNAGLGPVGQVVLVVKSAYVVWWAHLESWGLWEWDRHLGHWGPLSWASPKVAEPMGISRPSSENPGSVCFHSPVDRGHGAGWDGLAWHSEVPFRGPLGQEVHVRNSGDKNRRGVSLGHCQLWVSFCRPDGI